MNQLNAFEEHPDEFAVASYLEGRLPDEARAAIEAHFADCDECRRGLILLRGVEQLEAEPVPRGMLESAPERRRHFWAAAAAAVFLGALFVVPLTEIVRPGADGPPVFRDAGAQGPGLLSPAAGSVVRRDELSFSWTPVEGADRYRIRVWSVKTDFLREFEIPGGQTEAGWPADAPLAPVGELIWRVQALSLNRALAESAPAPFEVFE
jgi:hypothetical protein